MRKIKFRAWVKSKKYGQEMFGVVMIAWIGKEVILSGKGGSIDLKDCELMQFTGLKDKNGLQDVYEGDIVEGCYDFGHGKEWLTGSVFYDFNGFRLKVIDGDPKRNGQINYADFIEEDGTTFDDVTVIGNIYENPEMLKSAPKT